jgi:hypothetical protein
MGALPPHEPSPIERLLAHARQLRGHDSFADDFSMVDVTF